MASVRTTTIVGVMAGVVTLLAAAPSAKADWYGPGYGWRRPHYDRPWGPPAVVVAPPPYYYAPPPVVYAPPPVFYAPPRVVYAPPPVVYAPPRPVYYPPSISLGFALR